MTFLLSLLSISVSVWTLVLVSRSTSALEHMIKFCVTTEKLLPQLSLESKCTSYYTLKRSAFVCAFLLTFSILTWLWRAEFRSKTRANQLFLSLFDIFCWSFKCFFCHVTTVTLAYTILGVRVASYTDVLRGSSRVPLRLRGIDASVSKKKAEQHCGYHPSNTPPMQALSQLIQCNQNTMWFSFFLSIFPPCRSQRITRETKPSLTANCGGYLVVMRNYVWDATETPTSWYFDLLIDP